MNPLAPKAELFAFLITDENKDELADGIDPKDVMSASNRPGTPDTHVPGYYAVHRLISVDDPFVESLGARFRSVWITPPELFNAKFEIIERHWLYPDRLSIRFK
jgi:hypothetical protein